MENQTQNPLSGVKHGEHSVAGGLDWRQCLGDSSHWACGACLRRGSGGKFLELPDSIRVLDSSVPLPAFRGLPVLFLRLFCDNPRGSPHPSPGRTAVGRGPPPPHREATPGASLPHEAEPPSSCTQPPAAPRSPLTPGTTSRTDTSPLPHLVLPRAQGAPWPPSRGTDPSTFLERHRHFPLVRLKAGGLGAGSG